VPELLDAGTAVTAVSLNAVEWPLEVSKTSKICHSPVR
jgi:hypothetical protein